MDQKRKKDRFSNERETKTYIRNFKFDLSFFLITEITKREKSEDTPAESEIKLTVQFFFNLSCLCRCANIYKNRRTSPSVVVGRVLNI